MPEQQKQVACARAQQLIDALRQEPGHELKAHALEHAEQLQRAIHAFHMEAVRFRSYTLHRLLTQSGNRFTDEARRADEELREALEAMGVKTSDEGRGTRD